MARINVEQKALTDSRFAHLGLILSNPDRRDVEGLPLSALGLGCMIYVWNECQERETYVLPAVAIDSIGYAFGLQPVTLADAIVRANLGVKVRGGIRIRGTEGRAEWLSKARESNRNRQARFRERNAVTNGSVTPPSRGAPAPAPAPSSSPSETQKKNTSRGRSATPPFSRGFAGWWETYPARNGKKVGKAKAWTAWRHQRLEDRSKELTEALRRQIAHKADCDQRGAFCAELPDPERWIKNQRWLDEIAAAPSTPETTPVFVNRRLTAEEKAQLRAGKGLA